MFEYHELKEVDLALVAHTQLLNNKITYSHEHQDKRHYQYYMDRLHSAALAHAKVEEMIQENRRKELDAIFHMH